MRLLFVTRKHPPSIGGMQRLSYHLVSQMRRRAHVSAVTWGGNQSILPLFLPYALARSIVAGLGGVDLVHAGDPVVAPVGWVVGRLFGVPVVVTAHGLDITLPLKAYQWFIPRLLRSLDRIVCISQSTLRACTDRGIPPDHCVVIPPGVDVPATPPARDRARRALSQLLQKDLRDQPVLLTVGRLVRRKGVHWFVDRVLPTVLAANAEVRYVVIGHGPTAADIRAVAEASPVSGRVHLLGQVPADALAHIYVAADLFVMPNLPTSGDMEGFGLVALEAAAHGLPVLAADIEGIRDAVVPERTGRLLEPGNAEAWSTGVLRALGDPTLRNRVAREAPATVRQQFTWEAMADAYEQLFRQLISERRP